MLDEGAGQLFRSEADHGQHRRVARWVLRIGEWIAIRVGGGGQESARVVIAAHHEVTATIRMATPTTRSPARTQ